jgi:hypothetical protein
MNINQEKGGRKVPETAVSGRRPGDSLQEPGRLCNVLIFVEMEWYFKSPIELVEIMIYSRL